MTTASDKLATDYMMGRTIALLLSDLRTWKRDLSTLSFGVATSSHDETSRRPLLGILILAFNLWNACREIGSLLPELSSVPRGWERGHSTTEGDIQGSIDWQRTFEHRQKGGKGYIVHSFAREVQAQQATYIALLLQELLVHCDSIQSKLLTSFQDNTLPAYLIEVLKDIELTRAEVSRVLGDNYSSYLPTLASYIPSFEESLTGVFNMVDDLPKAAFSDYEGRVQIKPPTGTSLNSSVVKLRIWRERYLTCNVWLTGDDVFEYHRTGNIADLYEMWCFFEICAAVLRLGLQEVVQLCFVKRGQIDPQFRFGAESYVYFDYRTSSLTAATEEKLVRGDIPGVFIEWFILNKKEYERSICIDVKYATWESRDILKVMGYMLNFGIRNGVLIIRDEVRERTLGTEEIVPGLFRVQLRSTTGATLWVISLPPYPAEEEKNLRALERFVALAFSS